MRHKRTQQYRRLALVLSLAAVLGAGAVLAQTGGGYDLTWSTIDAGGGSSAGGSYQLSGTLGQPDAGAPLSGGGYVLSGGFWASAFGGSVYLPVVRQ